jgi:LPXTG-site transpeptidase (sortase) family protein
MASKKEDQSTFLLVGVILLVCIVAIIALFSGIWSLLQHPINYISSQLEEVTKQFREYDYNFEIPDIALEGNNNSEVNRPTVVEEEVGNKKEFKKFDGSVLSMNELNLLENGDKSIESPNINILIEKINVNSPMYQGNNSDDLLKKGFWIAPISSNFGFGEVLIFCHRTYFPENSPKSCWNADTLKSEDRIQITINSEVLTYEIISSGIVDVDNEKIYQLSNEDKIKIVTFTPRETGDKRLEIIAQRVE